MVALVLALSVVATPAVATCRRRGPSTDRSVRRTGTAWRPRRGYTQKRRGGRCLLNRRYVTVRGGGARRRGAWGTYAAWRWASCVGGRLPVAVRCACLLLGSVFVSCFVSRLVSRPLIAVALKCLTWVCLSGLAEVVVPSPPPPPPHLYSTPPSSPFHRGAHHCSYPPTTSPRSPRLRPSARTCWRRPSTSSPLSMRRPPPLPPFPTRSRCRCRGGRRPPSLPPPPLTRPTRRWRRRTRPRPRPPPACALSWAGPLSSAAAPLAVAVAVVGVGAAGGAGTAAWASWRRVACPRGRWLPGTQAWRMAREM